MAGAVAIFGQGPWLRSDVHARPSATLPTTLRCSEDLLCTVPSACSLPTAAEGALLTLGVPEQQKAESTHAGPLALEEQACFSSVAK